MMRTSWLAAGALVLTALFWGYSWVVIKKVVPYASAFDFAALRTLFGALFLFAIIALTRRPLRLPDWRKAFILGLLQAGIFTALVQWAVSTGGDAGKTAVLVYTMPFWTFLLAWLVLGERIIPVQWLAIALAMAGLILVLEPWNLHGSLTSKLLALAAGGVWALATILGKRFQRNSNTDVLSLTAWMMLFGALVLCPLALIMHSRPIDPAPYFFFAVFYSSLPATAIAWLLWLFALKHLPAGQAGFAALGAPLIGVAAAWIELGERPSPSEFGGIALIVGGLLLVSLWTFLRARLESRRFNGKSDVG